MTRRARIATALAAVALSFGIVAAASPAMAGVEDFTFESLDVQYYLDRDAGGHNAPGGGAEGGGQTHEGAGV